MQMQTTTQLRLKAASAKRIDRRRRRVRSGGGGDDGGRRCRIAELAVQTTHILVRIMALDERANLS